MRRELPELGLGRVWVLMLLLVSVFYGGQAIAQEAQSGGLTFGLTYGRSAHEANTYSFDVRAVATDRVPQTVVGRFVELHASAGIDDEGDLFPYSIDGQMGVGLATDSFTLFAASGVFYDAVEAFETTGFTRKDEVEMGVGVPFSLGLWMRPWGPIYAYAISEARWVFGAESREVESFSPFGFGEEYRLRGGIGSDIDDLHYRLEYIHHQVGRGDWHLITFSVGSRPETAPELGR